VSGPAKHVEFETLLAGFNAACSRFGSSRPGSDASFQAIFETLAWVGVLRDRLREERKPSPPALDGLYYVRNLVLHQGADVLESFLLPSGVLGASSLGTFALGSAGGQSIRWPNRANMPAPRSPKGAGEYDGNLAGKEVSDVLADVASALA
jgi:hypothetical protein